MGTPRENHPFVHGIFHEIIHLAIGVLPLLWKHPNGAASKTEKADLRWDLEPGFSYSIHRWTCTIGCMCYGYSKDLVFFSFSLTQLKQSKTPAVLFLGSCRTIICVPFGGGLHILLETSASCRNIGSHQRIKYGLLGHWATWTTGPYWAILGHWWILNWTFTWKLQMIGLVLVGHSWFLGFNGA